MPPCSVRSTERGCRSWRTPRQSGRRSAGVKRRGGSASGWARAARRIKAWPAFWPACMHACTAAAARPCANMQKREPCATRAAQVADGSSSSLTGGTMLRTHGAVTWLVAPGRPRFSRTCSLQAGRRRGGAGQQASAPSRLAVRNTARWRPRCVSIVRTAWHATCECR